MKQEQCLRLEDQHRYESLRFTNKAIFGTSEGIQRRKAQVVRATPINLDCNLKWGKGESGFES